MGKQQATIPQAKLLRLFELINMIASGKFRVYRLAAALDISQRTVYRYIALLNEVGFEITVVDSIVCLGTNHYPAFISNFTKKEVIHA